jgi:ribosomal-protein-alanine N-acetyltransferase
VDDRQFSRCARGRLARRVGERERRIVAYGVLMLSPGGGADPELSVVPDARREGLGRALLRPFRRRRAMAQCRADLLEVRESNVAAIALYATEGFAPVAPPLRLLSRRRGSTRRERTRW